MNNSKLAWEFSAILEEPDFTNLEGLRERETKLGRILEAIEALKLTKDWSTLKTEVFDNLAETLDKRLKEEAKQEQPDPLKLNRIAGQLLWAERYADLEKLAQPFKVELQGIKLRLHG